MSATPSRRELREAARRARAAAEAAGQAPPPTRRELRRLELEEQARLEAIATGELPILPGEQVPDGVASLSAATPVPAASVASATSATSTPSAPSAASAPSTTDPATAAVPTPARTPGAPSSADPPDVPVADRTPGVPASAHTPDSPVSAHTADEPAGRDGRVSRRPLRERVGAAADETVLPGPRTATRPVVRVPQSARAVRGLDATGALSQVRPLEPVPPGENRSHHGTGRPPSAAAPAGATPAPAVAPTDASSDPTAWESAVALPVVVTDVPGAPAVASPIISSVPQAAGPPASRSDETAAAEREQTAAPEPDETDAPEPDETAPSRTDEAATTSASQEPARSAQRAAPSAVSPAWAAGAVELRPSRRGSPAGQGGSPDRPMSTQQGPLAVAAAALDAQDRAGSSEGPGDDESGIAREPAAVSAASPGEQSVRWTTLGQFSAATSASAEEAGEGTGTADDGGTRTADDGGAGTADDGGTGTADDGGTGTAGGSRRRETRGRDRAGEEPLRRSVRDRMSATGGTSEAAVSPAHPTSEEIRAVEKDAPAVEDSRAQNPAASLVRIIVLVLAAVVIGLLIGLLAFRGEDTSGADLRIQGQAAAVQVPVGT